MRTMASVLYFVIVLVSVQKVFGNDVCLQNYDKFTCDECVRCGGEWCNVGSEDGTPRCAFSPGDGWCPNDQEYTAVVKAKPDKQGVDVSPVYAERNLILTTTAPDKIDITYSAKTTKKPHLTIVDSTQSFNIDLKQSEPKCSGSTCVFTVEVTPPTSFCTASGGVTESFEVKVDVGLKEEARIKYYVACACACSQKVERMSPSCNKRGNFTCGLCSCGSGWEGEHCENMRHVDCDNARGDLSQCSLNPKNDEDCSGNGYCGPCETCICYTDREGSQYFEQENKCAGLCSAAFECEECLVNQTIGNCPKCSMTFHRYNETLTKQKDEMDRKIWVKCEETFDDCGPLQFFASRDESKRIHVMMVNRCNEIIADAVVADTKVPIILGVLGIIAAVTTVGGVMLWKHLNAVPPVPLNDPQYQNIDAEDCTGENPLYKPPTSSFKNPTYGKW